MSLVVAVIKVAPRTEAWVHFELGDATASDGVVTMNFMDLHLLAESLRAYGRTVEVLQPAELKYAITNGLHRVVNAHA